MTSCRCMSEQEAIDLAQAQERVREELEDRQNIDPVANLGDDHIWTVSFYSGDSTVAEVMVDDETGTVNEVRVGPQVAWQMARGYEGAFGRIVNKPYIWLPLCLLFLAPFVDIRRPLRMLHLDLLVLLSFTVSHYYFNQGEIFTSVPLAYPPLVYLFLRLGYMAVRSRQRKQQAVVEPYQDLALTAAYAVTPPPPSRLHLNFSTRIIFIALIALLVFRIAMNIADSNVVDVGYSGVIGAHLILDGKTPYGNMPSDDSNGDTYGPLELPDLCALRADDAVVRKLGRSARGSRDRHPLRPAGDRRHVLCRKETGRSRTRREEGRRFGLALAWGWAAYPYTTFVLNCNVNDSIVAAFLIWGFVLLETAPLAGLMLGFATQIKFFPALLGPLWASFPRAWRGWGRRALFHRRGSSSPWQWSCP